MTDFTPLQALGPVAPFSADGDPSLAEYLAHYGLAPLLSEQVGLYVGYTVTQRYQLWTQVWSPAEPIGTAFVVHGYYDHLGLYRHLLEQLLERRWRVVLWDLPGHGLSSGRRACIDDFSHYGECLQALQEQLESKDLAPKPWLGVGQSTGAAILATDALSRPDEGHWSGLVLLAPLVRPSGWPQAGWLHTLVGPFVQSLPRRFGPNSTDAEFAAFLRERDPLQPEYLSLNWVSAMRRWMPQLLALPSSDLPTLILQGEQDLTVDWEWNLSVLERKFPQARIHRHPEARHHLVNEAEPIRTILFATLDEFVAELEPGFVPVTQEPISRC
ncbi:alpha/beta hydrolase [Billgrantia kenyensis]|uniref:Alpha/beta hydrolase n=1 Tax=Billgrantia kenyensis TaxID=321266 RepID=A0A7V9W2G7_9GAMM|nr:alpha/beta hydrolase [Halomonas kenyensis]MBA2779795.1 alpha/beta hydrolase [Halomonas kenyensis]MCG6662196.1 alpha/beta hydrolase [Halomonas kenyensis]